VTESILIPRRRWGGEPRPAVPRPIVLVSSRDGAQVPNVAGAARLARAAEAAGWLARQTYALADVPAAPRRAAHRLASVAVRFARVGAFGWATWHSVDDGPWRYAGGCLAFERLGLRELTARVSAP
jgi:hypothetical protein